MFPLVLPEAHGGLKSTCENDAVVLNTRLAMLGSGPGSMEQAIRLCKGGAMRW